jgi:hypothetical protein
MGRLVLFLFAAGYVLAACGTQPGPPLGASRCNVELLDSVGTFDCDVTRTGHTYEVQVDGYMVVLVAFGEAGLLNVDPPDGLLAIVGGGLTCVSKRDALPGEYDLSDGRLLIDGYVTCAKDSWRYVHVDVTPP